MGALERMVVMVTPEQKAAITSRAKAQKLTMGELVRRSVDRYSSAEDDRLLERFMEQVNASTARADRALDDALRNIEAGLRRIEAMERRVRPVPKRNR